MNLDIWIDCHVAPKKLQSIESVVFPLTIPYKICSHTIFEFKTKTESRLWCLCDHDHFRMSGGADAQGLGSFDGLSVQLVFGQSTTTIHKSKKILTNTIGKNYLKWCPCYFRMNVCGRDFDIDLDQPIPNKQFSKIMFSEGMVEKLLNSNNKTKFINLTSRFHNISERMMKSLTFEDLINLKKHQSRSIKERNLTKEITFRMFCVITQFPIIKDVQTTILLILFWLLEE